MDSIEFSIKNLKNALKSLGWTQADLALRASRNRSTVTNALKRGSASRETLRKFAEAISGGLRENGSDPTVQEVLADLTEGRLGGTSLVLEAREGGRSGGATRELPPSPFFRPGEARQIAVLIPGAGPVPEGVMSQSKVDHIGMVLLAGQPIIQRQVKYLRSLGLGRFWVGTRKGGGLIDNFCRAVFRDVELHLVVDDRMSGVAATVLALAEEAKGAGATSVLVVLGDTHFRFEDPAVLKGELPLVLYQKAPHPHRWALFTPSTDPGIAKSFEEKPKHDYSGFEAEALIGVYWFPSLEALITLANSAVPEDTSFEMSHVLSSFPEVRVARAGDWWDVGHPDRHVEASLRILEASAGDAREFQSVEIDFPARTITKRIKQGASERRRRTLEQEAEYYRLLPNRLRPLFPRLLESSVYRDDVYLRLEYYGYDTLTVPFLAGQLHPEIWGGVFERLAEVVDYLHRGKLAAEERALREMYLEKTQRRLDQVAAQVKASADADHHRLAALLRGGTQVDGELSLGLRALLEEAQSGINDLIRNRCQRFSVIHGDLHFANILHDLSHGIFRFIDPRGAFGRRNGVLGDPLYDIAKLYHSVHGLYDCIVNNMFSVEPNGNGGGTDLRLEIYKPLKWELIVREFEEVFFRGRRTGRKYGRDDVLLLNFLLFASMLPIHSDQPRRQLAMAIQAVRYFREWSGEGPQP